MTSWFFNQINKYHETERTTKNIKLNFEKKNS